MIFSELYSIIVNIKHEHIKAKVKTTQYNKKIGTACQNYARKTYCKRYE